MIRSGDAARGIQLRAPPERLTMTTTPATAPLVLVTGATDGIGRQTAVELVRRGADVIAHGRSAERLRETHAALERAAGRAQPAPVRADLASLAEVRALADELDRRALRPSVLLHNAGVFMNERRASADGFEMTFA